MAESKHEHARFAAIFASGTLFSRILGLVRDVIWMGFIPTASLGPFLVAWKFPNMLRDLVGEGAANAAMVPVFSERLEKDGESGFRETVAAVMAVMTLVLLALTVIGMVVVPLVLEGSAVLNAFTPEEGLTGDTAELTKTLSQWVFPYLFFIGMSVFAMGALFTAKQYVVPSWSPALLNIAFILCTVFLARRYVEPAYALVAGVWAGGAAQLTAHYLALGRQAGVWRPSFDFRHPAIKTIFVLMIPVLFGQAAAEVNKLVDTLFAYRLGDYVVKALYTANRLVQLPLSMFGLAVAAAILPSISRAGARNDDAEIRRTLQDGFCQTAFLVLPAMFGLILLREPVVRLLFERGSFSAEDTAYTATALGIYGAGLIWFAWVKVAVTGFFAVQNTKTPVAAASASMILNIVLNFILVGPLHFKGLALATTISFALNFLLLYALLGRRFGGLWDAAFASSMTKIAIATAVMSAVVYGCLTVTDQWTADRGAYHTVMTSVAPIAAGIATYAAACALLRVEEMRNFLNGIRRRRR